MSPVLVRGRLLDALFRQVATTGTVGADPVADALAAGAADGEDMAGGLAALEEADRLQVCHEVATLDGAAGALRSGAGRPCPDYVPPGASWVRVVGPAEPAPGAPVQRPNRPRRDGILSGTAAAPWRTCHSV